MNKCNVCFYTCTPKLNTDTVHAKCKIQVQIQKVYIAKILSLQLDARCNLHNSHETPCKENMILISYSPILIAVYYI